MVSSLLLNLLCSHFHNMAKYLGFYCINFNSYSFIIYNILVSSFRHNIVYYIAISCQKIILHFLRIACYNFCQLFPHQFVISTQKLFLFLAPLYGHHGCKYYPEAIGHFSYVFYLNPRKQWKIEYVIMLSQMYQKIKNDNAGYTCLKQIFPRLSRTLIVL